MKTNNLHIISHRGCISGPCKLENQIIQIEKALKLGFDVEIDIRYLNGYFWLGHNETQEKCPESFLRDKQIWVHAKDLYSLCNLKHRNINVFWHQNDDYTLTSKGNIWTCKKENLFEECVFMDANCQSIYDIDNKEIYGICSDYPKKIKQSCLNIY